MKHTPVVHLYKKYSNEFKIKFSTVDENSDAGKWKRAVNTQKCIRAGGKHNDLDDVGKDVYHHTFFEMLGNWSFGDFFKKEICKWAWELLTVEFGLDPNRLYVTYFGGSKENNLEPDNECKDIWINEVGVAPERVIPGNMKDNFWEMGDTGPCGPCSELHYDRIGGRNAANLVNQDDPDVLEIWNLVFIQFNRESDGELKLLPKRHVDTGMGFERLVSVIQDKRSNYDTDIFAPIFEKIRSLTNVRPYSGKLGSEDEQGIDMAYRVVADHIRTITIALADGGVPDNVGRGYVLRRVLRRAVRYSTEKLMAKPGMFASLTPVVVENLGDIFPELHKDIQYIMDTINAEEQQFLKTLSRGRKLLEREINKLKDKKTLPGDVAWKLYDTYGFPVDLTYLMVEEKGFDIDLPAYEECKIKAQLKSQAVSSKEELGLDLDVHGIAELKDNKKIPVTDDSFKYNYKSKSSSEYEFEPCNGQVVALRKDKKFIDKVVAGDEVGIILDKTNFYAEQGGQIYDTGLFVKENSDENSLDDSEFEVCDVKFQGGYIVHIGKVLIGEIKVGDKLKLFLDEIRRKNIMNNHTGTHVLNYGLRKVLGTEADQRGSLVAPEKLRFDFTCKQALTVRQIKEVEAASIEMINKDLEVFSEIAPLEESKKIQGLRAVFDETYPDPVRVVSVGVPVKELLSDPNGTKGLETSVEFCGGTHLIKTGHIGDFVVTSEEAIAKGIRRIVAISGPEGQKALAKTLKLERQINKMETELMNKKFINSKETLKDLLDFLEELNQSQISYWKKDELRNRISALKKSIDDVEKASKNAVLNEVVENAKKLVDNLENNFVVAKLNAGSNNKILDAALKQMIKINPNVAAMLISNDEKKVICLSIVSKELSSKLKANEWIKEICPTIDGKGGGKAESAQASGSNIDNIEKAVELAKTFAKLKLN
ncbi:hypothetical protein RND71_043597 [Anisodus tanguticus]|uniref:Alanine--tRNA ligase n=1 Tax=Anisodus tanguticus TaxID=243964 RepID=A0AAE1QPD6_9SOLA|nr:hypothetical protein RND71_043597 [Anisodus tanguticus]